jgi:hypothetical protein
MDLHVILLNKNIDSSMTATVTITGGANYESMRVWSFDSSSSAIAEKLTPPVISNNSFTLSVPRLTACHCVLTAGSSVRENKASPSAQSAFKILYTHGSGPILAYDFPLTDQGKVSLYTLRGALIMRSGLMSGRGVIALDRKIVRTTDGNFLAVWKSTRGTCVRRVVTVSQ